MQEFLATETELTKQRTETGLTADLMYTSQALAVFGPMKPLRHVIFHPPYRIGVASGVGPRLVEPLAEYFFFFFFFFF